MFCHHYCNCPLRCPECVSRFWKWAENHTRGSPKTRSKGPIFYEAAGKSYDENHGGRPSGRGLDCGSD
jgi:hypothetical protein